VAEQIEIQIPYYHLTGAIKDINVIKFKIQSLVRSCHKDFAAISWELFSVLST